NLSYDGKGLHARQRLNRDLKSNSEAHVTSNLDKFEGALSSLRSFQLRTTITRENLDLLYDSLLATLGSTGYKMFVSHHASPLRAMHFGEADIDKLGAVYARVVDTLAAGQEYEKLLRLRNIRNWVNTIHAGKTRQIACGAGVSYLTVSATGRY